MKIAEFNLETGLIQRDMNDDELAQYEKDQEENRQNQMKKDAKAAQKAALLDRLGITEDEAKLLLA